MEKLRNLYSGFRYKGILAIILVFLVITFVLFAERSGIRYNYENRRIDYLSHEKIVTKQQAQKDAPVNTLVLFSSKYDDSLQVLEQFEVIFCDMKIGYDIVDVSMSGGYDFSKYENTVVMLSDLEPLGENILTLCKYVQNGGNVLFTNTLSKSPFTSIIENKLGILDSSYSYAVCENMYVSNEFMIGGGRSFEIDDPFESSWSVQLDNEKTTVYAYTDDEHKVPLVWKTQYGKGTFVVDNLGMYEKVMRGFYAASYSLLGDLCVYPVINGSVFFLDDFPSQIPSGNSAYITRDYNTSIRDFYVNIWWPDMMNFSDKYGLKYTGLAIECYDDAVDGTTDAKADKGTFLNFGNMLLRHGGEIGYHGYNHQPLCFDNVDYKGQFDYKTWESYEAMKSAFDELVDFCKELFPKVRMEIYVPPSNILSQEGREFLLNEYKQIKTISGIYFEDQDVEMSCVQEFEVSEEGIVDQPRVVSGCKLENFMSLAVISELNLHFINSHFTHPDDALDIDRGAELGWEKLSEHFEEYLDWVYTSALSIRNLTGSEMSAAIERFAAVNVTKQIQEDKLQLKLGNFYDEAYLMLRFNTKQPEKVTGGKLTHITGDLYLLEAKKSDVTVYFE